MVLVSDKPINTIVLTGLIVMVIHFLREGIIKKSRKSSCLMKSNVTKRVWLLAIKVILSPSRKKDAKVGGIAEEGHGAEGR
jgi:hypothetical protein